MTTRYKLKWIGPQDFVCVPMEDGYWIPRHIAQLSFPVKGSLHKDGSLNPDDYVDNS